MSQKGKILVGTVGQTIMMSDDDGESWRRLGPRDGMHSDGIVRTLTADPGRPDDDGGDTWRKLWRSSARCRLSSGCRTKSHIRVRGGFALIHFVRGLGLRRPLAREGGGSGRNATQRALAEPLGKRLTVRGEA